METFLSPELFWCTDELTLAGTRCQSCGNVGFPVSAFCSGCGRRRQHTGDADRAGRGRRGGADLV